MLLGPLPDRPSLQQEVRLKIHGRTRQSRATSLPRKRLSFSTNPPIRNSPMIVKFQCIGNVWAAAFLLRQRITSACSYQHPGRSVLFPAACGILYAASYINREGVSQDHVVRHIPKGQRHVTVYCLGLGRK